jgi:hypothetical protein
VYNILVGGDFLVPGKEHMRIGDMVQIIPRPSDSPDQESIFAGLHGIIVRDHSPMRPLEVGRVFDVMWNNGNIEDMYSDDLEVIDENR